MLKFKVTDGLHSFFCIEHRHFSQIKTIEIGSKWVLVPAITVRRGVALLNHLNLKHICSPSGNNPSRPAEAPQPPPKAVKFDFKPSQNRAVEISQI
jgi:hypothetical protein